MDCAIRETLEECGFDATGRVREEDSFTIVQNAKKITLYVVKDVPEDFNFQPQVSLFPLLNCLRRGALSVVSEDRY